MHRSTIQCYFNPPEKSTCYLPNPSSKEITKLLVVRGGKPFITAGGLRRTKLYYKPGGELGRIYEIMVRHHKSLSEKLKLIGDLLHILIDEERICSLYNNLEFNVNIRCVADSLPKAKVRRRKKFLKRFETFIVSLYEEFKKEIEESRIEFKTLYVELSKNVPFFIVLD